jgi:Zn-dependent metalloprotease
MKKSRCLPFCSILPPHMLDHLAENGDAADRQRARQAQQVTAAARGARQAMGPMAGVFALSPGEKRRTVFDAQHRRKLPGKLVRSEGGAPTSDTAVNEAYDGAGATYDLFQQVFRRNSIDGNGMRLDQSVHFSRDFNNAFWDGRQMVYGDGDGVIFRSFTRAIDVIGHELAHGVTQFTAQLVYEDESGALNEHFSDVFGSLVKQRVLNQTADRADWLIGAGLLGPTIHGRALRDMANPGTAYNDPRLGRDPQPAHMSNFVHTSEDNGGVHINSGIPNKAFTTIAKLLGGFAWEKAGRIWYATLDEKLEEEATFQECADATYEVAGELFDAGTQEVVRQGWRAVGIDISAAIVAGGPTIAIRHAPAAAAPGTAVEPPPPYRRPEEDAQ